MICFRPMSPCVRPACGIVPLWDGSRLATALAAEPSIVHSIHRCSIIVNDVPEVFAEVIGSSQDVSLIPPRWQLVALVIRPVKVHVSKVQRIWVLRRLRTIQYLASPKRLSRHLGCRSLIKFGFAILELIKGHGWESLIGGLLSRL